MTKLNFLKSILTNDQVSVYLAPDFVDLSKTDFPDGVLLGGQNLSPVEAENFIAALQHFFSAFIDDLKDLLADEPAYLQTAHYTEPVITVSSDYETRRWTSIYWDAHDNGVELKLLPYVRLVPVVMDTEAAGFSHGVSVFNQFFETEREAFKASAKLENFMNVVLAELLAHHVKS